MKHQPLFDVVYSLAFAKEMERQLPNNGMDLKAAHRKGLAAVLAKARKEIRKAR